MQMFVRVLNELFALLYILKALHAVNFFEHSLVGGFAER